MKSLWTAADRIELISRIDRLSPQSTAIWGRMNVSQMVAHLTDWMRMVRGEIDVKTKLLPVRFQPLKYLFIHVLPIPKGLPTAPELIGRPANDWFHEREALRNCIDDFANITENDLIPDHPIFGKMSRNDWGVLGYRHTHHHLKQFGV